MKHQLGCFSFLEKKNHAAWWNSEENIIYGQEELKISNLIALVTLIISQVYTRLVDKNAKITVELRKKSMELKLIWSSDLSEPTMQGLTPETLPLKKELQVGGVLWVSGRPGLLNKSHLNKTKQPER